MLGKNLKNIADVVKVRFVLILDSIELSHCLVSMYCRALFCFVVEVVEAKSVDEGDAAEEAKSVDEGDENESDAAEDHVKTVIKDCRVTIQMDRRTRTETVTLCEDDSELEVHKSQLSLGISAEAKKANKETDTLYTPRFLATTLHCGGVSWARAVVRHQAANLASGAGPQ